ncbi:uncharacterized protein LOC126760661 [Bactrocera neohumeralis]|uniref:uncharacterized protein LOC120775679 n=1 Tax=Bactrocera tryoni TaxID=59916 RepID=UPI001A99E4E7|nr:uncharacterized protein LOC120775679 [Bactrocera tryoni]XP_050332433.1 uncharacterized protein LOC126760661 [Bactrocera neohumeralis]
MAQRLQCNMLCLFICCMLIGYSWQYCYQLKILSFRSTDTPDYRLVMDWQKNMTLTASTYVRKAVATPTWHLQLLQLNTKRNQLGKIEPPKSLYNATYKTCEFWKYVKRIRVFNNVAQQLLSKSGGNMSLDCPLSVGTYVFKNIHVPPDTGMLKFMYWPNTIYTLLGTVYDQRPNKTLEKLCHYEINGTVIKSC